MVNFENQQWASFICQRYLFPPGLCLSVSHRRTPTTAASTTLSPLAPTLFHNIPPKAPAISSIWCLLDIIGSQLGVRDEDSDGEVIATITDPHSTWVILEGGYSS